MTTSEYIGVIIIAIPVIVFLFNWLWNKYSQSILINWPVFGMIPQLLLNASCAHDFLTSVLQRSGGTFHFKGPWSGGWEYMLVSDPVNINYIYNKNFTNYHKGEEFREMFEPLGDGFITSDGDNWRAQRRILHSLLLDKRYENAVERITEMKILIGLFQVLDKASKLGTILDLQDVFQRFTFDNISMLILGFDPNCLSIEFPHVPFEKAFHYMEESGFYRHIVPASIWKLQRWLQIGREKALRQAWNTFDDFVADGIERKRVQLSQNKIQIENQEFDLITYFLGEDAYEEEDNNNNNNNNNFIIDTKSNKFIRDTAFNLLAAGRDTIASGLVWLFWLVGKHPTVEKKILEELKANFQEGNWRLFNFDELNNLVYLHAVVCETLRLYPPVPINHMVSIEPDVLPTGHRIPKDMKVLFLIYSMGRMKELWGKDCSEFKPERWITDRGEIKHVPTHKFLTFNAGPRSCLGKKITLLQMKAVASALIWNYSFQEVESDHPVEPKSSIILYMKHGTKVRVTKRHAF